WRGAAGVARDRDCHAPAQLPFAEAHDRVDRRVICRRDGGPVARRQLHADTTRAATDARDGDSGRAGGLVDDEAATGIDATDLYSPGQGVRIDAAKDDRRPW